ncbi:3'-5' exonuclease [Bifidobacterium moukalabense]|uniref:3'-5' exonuclease n=1 Tax=Bifidobacterium moukalabense TaxID=1333651 RepID=UPI0010F80051|nr:3'-5' exonuclease [Bifidobacterium moukalabense]
MYWDRYINRNNPRRIEPLDRPLDTYVMLDTETTGLHPEEGATIIEIGALLVTPGNENARPRFEQLVDPQRPLTEFITDLTGISDGMLRGKPTIGAAMLRFHQWLDDVWPAGRPLTVIAHNAEFDIGFLDAAERAHDPSASEFDCRWLCTKEMSWELNPQKRHHRVSDLIADYHIGDVEEHRALSDAIQEHMIYRALCREASIRGRWGRERVS